MCPVINESVLRVENLYYNTLTCLSTSGKAFKDDGGLSTLRFLTDVSGSGVETAGSGAGALGKGSSSGTAASGSTAA